MKTPAGWWTRRAAPWAWPPPFWAAWSTRRWCCWGSAAGRALLDPVEAAFKQNVFPPCGNVRFALAQLGNNAGIFGGAALFFTQSA